MAREDKVCLCSHTVDQYGQQDNSMNQVTSCEDSKSGSSHRGSAVTSLTSIHEEVGSIPELAQCVKRIRRSLNSLSALKGSGAAMSCGLGRRHDLDPPLLWPAATVPDSTPSLGTSICHGCGPKKTKKPQQSRKRESSQSISAQTMIFLD